ncbi:MAG: hypothetical protein HZC42_15900 [Candidatus Eisenbacteria bacterium]|nr:hypothetical protein [Candidatus Eisenbacteria bacterium]
MRLPIAVLLMLPVASVACATEIQGKWGIGVGVFNYRSEVSLLRGHSPRTAWLLDFGFHQSGSSGAQDPLLPKSLWPGPSSGTAVELGPRARSFTRPESDFSPYVDVFVHGSWSGAQSPGPTRYEMWAARAGVAFGLEYFLPRWHCSLAAHSDLMTFSYERQRWRTAGLGRTLETWQSVQRADLGISPGLALRVYF